MGFTAWLAFVYLILLTLTIVSFLRKKNKVGATLLVLMFLGIFALGYLWMTSPM